MNKEQAKSILSIIPNLKPFKMPEESHKSYDYGYDVCICCGCDLDDNNRHTYGGGWVLCDDCSRSFERLKEDTDTLTADILAWHWKTLKKIARKAMREK